MSIKKTWFVALALTGALGAGVAQARDNGDVQWSVTIGAPIGLPIYSQPYPVYTQPVPIYRGGYSYPRHAYPRHEYGHPTRWDRDGDRIPNRYDRVYNPRWDRDGDGIPNRYDRRYDRRDNLRHDHDRDGGSNRRDRNDRRDGRGWDR
jgi:hypothetical protein